MLAPTSKFSNTIATGIRVSLKTHAPLHLSARFPQPGIATNRELPYSSHLSSYASRVARVLQYAAILFPSVTLPLDFGASFTSSLCSRGAPDGDGTNPTV